MKTIFSAIFFLLVSGTVFSQYHEMPPPPPPAQDLSKESETVRLTKISEFPKQIFGWNVKQLIISESDNLKEIPKEIGNFKNLNYFLITGGHQITKFPKEFTSLKNIKKLSLHNFRTEQIPVELFNLSGVQEFEYFTYSYFTFPKELGKFKDLTKLILSRGTVRREGDMTKKEGNNLPSSIKSMKKLEEFSASSNLMTELPSEIGSLSMLKDVSLSNNLLSKLPNTFSQLQNLKTLTLSNNKFTVFPKELYELQSLTRIDIYENQIDTFPQGAEKMKSLIGLFINKNKISENALKEIYKIPNLEVLDLGDCQLKSFPPGIEQMKTIKKIYVQGNFIPQSEVDRAQRLLPPGARIVNVKMY